MKKVLLLVVVGAGAVFGLRRARPAPVEADLWSAATDRVPR